MIPLMIFLGILRIIASNYLFNYMQFIYVFVYALIKT